MYVGPLPIRAYVSVHASCQSSLRAALARCVHMLRAVVTARSAISKFRLELLHQTAFTAAAPVLAKSSLLVVEGPTAGVRN